MAELTRDVALARAHGEAARNYYAARPGLDLKDGPIVAVHHAASFSDHYQRKWYLSTSDEYRLF